VGGLYEKTLPFQGLAKIYEIRVKNRGFSEGKWLNNSQGLVPKSERSRQNSSESPVGLQSWRFFALFEAAN
jgi:hypothetical protein